MEDELEYLKRIYINKMWEDCMPNLSKEHNNPIIIGTSEENSTNSTIFEVHITCPKCGSKWIGDIGYDNWQCFDCDETWRQKSKTGFEIDL